MEYRNATACILAYVANMFLFKERLVYLLLSIKYFLLNTQAAITGCFASVHV